MTGTSATDWIGRTIDGRYVIEALLGRGGMGVVLAARHKFTGARVAVKIVRPDLGVDAEITARFLAEARAPTAIDHRGVVKTLDAGRTAEGELYLVMELLTGRSLREQMMSGLGGPTLRRITMELLDVMAAAHARGIIHRDVKPENVFLVEPELSVKLLDFGITKVLAGTASLLPRTAAGVLLGTVAYMAPEQLADASTVDARADLWSASVIIYEMMSGRRPHLATTVEEMFVALLKTEPDPIRVAMPSATLDVEAFFARALARDPRQRFATAGEMAMAFAKLPLASAPPPVARRSGGTGTMATSAAGFGATAATGSGATAATGFGATAATGLGSAAAPGLGAIGFAATLATPERGTPSVSPANPGPRPAPVAPSIDPAALAQVPVLTPFSGTPALVGAVPGHATPQSAGWRAAPPAPPTPPTPPTYPAAVSPVHAPMPPSLPSLATPATAAPVHAVPAAVGAMPAAARPPRRRVAWMLAGALAIAIGAVIVVAVHQAQHETVAPPPGQERVALPSTPSPPAPAPAPSPAPTQPAAPSQPPEPAFPPGTAPDLTTSLAPEHSPGPAATPKPAHTPRSPESPPSAPSQPSRPDRTHPKDRPIDPYAHTAGVTPSTPATAPTTPTSPTTTAAAPANTCTAGCRLLASCHLGSSTCEADCAQHGTLGTCLQQAGNDCNRFAACWFASSCRGVSPRGQQTCLATMGCEAACTGDTTCICGCIARLSIDHAAALLGYNGCALTCRDADCIARCERQSLRCRAE